MPEYTTSQFPLGVTAVMLPELAFDEQIKLCSDLNLFYYVYRPRVISEAARSQAFSNWGNHQFDLTPQRLHDEGESFTQQLRSHQLEPFGTVPNLTVDADDENLRLHFEGAAKAEAFHVRCNPAPYPAGPAGLFDFDAYLAETRKHYHRAIAIAAPLNVKLVIEMHTGNAAISPGLARLIVEGFDPAHLGLIVDLPNFSREGGVLPNLAISAIAPWVDHVHLGGNRKTEGKRDERGIRRAADIMCGLDDSDMYFPGWLAVLAQLDRPVPLIIEDYTPDVPGEKRLRDTVEVVRRLVGNA